MAIASDSTREEVRSNCVAAKVVENENENHEEMEVETDKTGI